MQNHYISRLFTTIVAIQGLFWVASGFQRPSSKIRLQECRSLAIRILIKNEISNGASAICSKNHLDLEHTLMPSEVQASKSDENVTKNRKERDDNVMTSSIVDSLLKQISKPTKRPPVRVDDSNILLYDVILLINLAVTISFWVTHRMNFNYIGEAFSEGCLMSMLWIGSGLYTGAFLYSAIDGHHGSDDIIDGGPKGAGLLAAHTFTNAVNMRLVFALLVSMAEHRPVGLSVGEEIMPIEIGFGYMLMVLWRVLHSSYVTR